MKRVFTTLFASLLVTPLAMAGGNDDPLLAKLTIDRLEVQAGDGPDPLVLEGDLWIGYDLNKLWLKADMEQVDGTVEEQELQLLYSRAISPYWDLQFGGRRDFKPQPEHDWVALGLHGTAPYFIETDIALFRDNDGQTELRLLAEYELMFTQRWFLSSELEMSAFGKSEPLEGIGKGASSLGLNLRLGYEIRREFAPYIGINWHTALGETADLARQTGGEVSETRYVAGVSFWF
ncbi:MAG: copper resistance protein B [Chromatiales bacterium]|nr:copper resistance protein B [Chromatiales bacterium]